MKFSDFSVIEYELEMKALVKYKNLNAHPPMNAMNNWIDQLNEFIIKLINGRKYLVQVC